MELLPLPGGGIQGGDMMVLVGGRRQVISQWGISMIGKKLQKLSLLLMV